MPGVQQTAFDAIGQHQERVRRFEREERLLREERRKAGPLKSRVEKVCGTKRHREQIKGTMPLTKFIRSAWHNDALTMTLADDLIGGVAHHLAQTKDFRSLCAFACVDSTCSRSVAAYLQTVAADLRQQMRNPPLGTLDLVRPLGLTMPTMPLVWWRDLGGWHITHAHTPLCPNSNSVIGYLSGACELCPKTDELRFVDGPIPMRLCRKCRTKKTVTVRVHINLPATGGAFMHVGIEKVNNEAGYGHRYARTLLARHQKVTTPPYRARYNALWDRAFCDMDSPNHRVRMITRIRETPQLTAYLDAPRPNGAVDLWSAIRPPPRLTKRGETIKTPSHSTQLTLFVDAPKGTNPNLEFDTFLGLKGCDEAFIGLECDEEERESYLDYRKCEQKRDRDHRKRFYMLHKTPHAQKANIATYKLMTAHNRRPAGVPEFHRHYIGWTGIIHAIAPLSLGEAIDSNDRMRSVRAKKASVLISSTNWSTPAYKAIVGECLTITELHQFCFGVRAASMALRHSLVSALVLEDEFDDGGSDRGYALKMQPASVVIRLLDLPTYWWPRLGPLGTGSGPLIRQFAAIVYALMNATIIFKAVDEPVQPGDTQTIVGWLSGCDTGANNTPTGLPYKIKITWTLDLKQRKKLVWNCLCINFVDGDCDPVALTTGRVRGAYEGHLTRIERALNRKGGVRAHSAWHALFEAPNDLPAVVEFERKAAVRDPARVQLWPSDAEDDN